jgi:P2 family phage contractile tail tube protein
MAWLDNKNAVLADTCYCDNQLAAKDVSVNLPAVTFLTSEVNAMGKMDVILPGLIEAMEASVTKVGLDTGLSKMLTPTKHNFEFRWAQNVLKSDGTTEPEGCKAFITGVPKGVPATGLEIGSNIESEISIGCTRYQLFVNGVEILCIDRLSQICRINGVDYYNKIASVL